MYVYFSIPREGINCMFLSSAVETKEKVIMDAGISRGNVQSWS